MRPKGCLNNLRRGNLAAINLIIDEESKRTKQQKHAQACAKDQITAHRVFQTT